LYRNEHTSCKANINLPQCPPGALLTANGIEFIAGFFVAMAMTFIIIPWLIPRLKVRGVVGTDLNKPSKPEIAEMGGIAAVVGFFAGVSVLVALNGITNIDLLNVSLSAALGAAFVGMMDDLFDLRQRHKAFLPFVIALPFAAAVDQHVVIPHVVDVNFGPWMLLVAAFAVTCAANAANMLEGFNGLGTGLGIIMSITLIILSVMHNRMDGVYLLVPLMGSLVAFLWFNKYPAQIFPGDTMMLFMGATMAVAGILSNLQVQTAFIFIPMIVEFFLKLRGHFKAENYCSEAGNGFLEYHGRIESLTHVFMKHLRVNERELVAFIWGVEIAMCIIVISVDLVL
jgi:UDP-N-acetylglucosamine--dolichyl-phosphate N-acetylglucosaminephosphotransferase